MENRPSLVIVAGPNGAGKSTLSERFIFRKITIINPDVIAKVLSLTWEMIDLEKGVYYIPASINKARKHMTYRLTPLLIEALKLSPTQAGLVFPSPATGNKISNTKHAWKDICAKAEINKPLRIHDLRHLIGNIGANSGMSEVVLAAILGHTNTRVTKRYYQVQTDVAAEGINKIHSLISP
ncbi:MAG: tyrosine-type recombinase/integrase [Helicobacteraceae bacterium]|jgi:integrase|nr:tyrosine-type recombinase/integrase [Helicobacteraceae bacterium]